MIWVRWPPPHLFHLLFLSHSSSDQIDILRLIWRPSQTMIPQSSPRLIIKPYLVRVKTRFHVLISRDVSRVHHTFLIWHYVCVSLTMFLFLDLLFELVLVVSLFSDHKFTVGLLFLVLSLISVSKDLAILLICSFLNDLELIMFFDLSLQSSSSSFSLHTNLVKILNLLLYGSLLVLSNCVTIRHWVNVSWSLLDKLLILHFHDLLSLISFLLELMNVLKILMASTIIINLLLLC